MASNPMDKAEKAFKKEEQRREGARNRSDYEQERIAEEKKTERLRALRLAHEAQQAGAKAAADAANPPKTVRTRKPAKKKSADNVH